MEEKNHFFEKSKILLVEKEICANTESPLSQPIEKKESAKKILFDNNNPQKRVAIELKKDLLKNRTNFEFEAAKTFVNKETEKITEKSLYAKPDIQESTKILSEPDIESITEIYTNTEINAEIDTEIDADNNQKIEIDNNQLIKTELFTFNKDKNENKEDNSNKQSKKVRPGLKARLKIFTFGFLAILTCFIGWSIYNAVEIETLRAQMQESNKIYAVNIVNYIKNISKADDLTSSDSIYNLQLLSEAKIIPIAPTLEPHVEYSVNSNWFDRLCNWLTSIFK